MANMAYVELTYGFESEKDATGWAHKVQDFNANSPYNVGAILGAGVMLSYISEGYHRSTRPDRWIVTLQGEVKWCLHVDEVQRIFLKANDHNAVESTIFCLETGDRLIEEYCWDKNHHENTMTHRWLPGAYWPDDDINKSDKERGYDSFDEEVERRMREHGVEETLLLKPTKGK